MFDGITNIYVYKLLFPSIPIVLSTHVDKISLCLYRQHEFLLL